MKFENPLLHKATYSPPRVAAVIGAGAIGPDIGYFLLSDLLDLQRLVIVDISPKALESARKRIAAYLDKAVARGRLESEKARNLLERTEFDTRLSGLGDADWVIECATEDLAIKHRIFNELESIVSPETWITSNSSSLPAREMFAHMALPGRCTVTHFFSPAWRNPVVEVIDWPGADPDLADNLRHLLCMCGKVPLRTADVTCFMLDRIFDNWCNEAALLIPSASAAQIDSAVSDLVGAGPFFVLNMARGNPIIIAANTTQADAEGEHYRPAAILQSVDRWTTVAMGEKVPVAPELAEHIRTRLVGAVLSQAVDILDRQIGSAADLDLGCRLALGFRRGPTEMIDDMGAGTALAVLQRFQADRPGMPGAGQPLADYAPAFRHILVDDYDDVRVLTIRRPEALNALHDDLTDELLDAIRLGEDDPAVRGFVITGYGARAFCAGADIGRFPAMLGDAEASADYARACSRLLVHLDRMRKPVVAAINGLALGGGLELAMRCHALVAMRSARFQLPEITLGIAPGIGALVVPFRRWPGASEIFSGMILEAQSMSADEAHQHGVVSALADDVGDLLREAIAQVHRHELAGPSQYDKPVEFRVARPPVGRTRYSGQIQDILIEAINAAAAAPSFNQALEIGYRAFGSSACTAAAKEGIAAFTENRKADFSVTG